MKDDDVLVLSRSGISAVLRDREGEILAAVRNAYEVHAKGDTRLPHSCFLHLPDPAKRIIALPAYLGGSVGVAGVKWIASVPANVAQGMERASAVIVSNDPVTGRARAVLEGSVVSAKRTAASAALAASCLLEHEDAQEASFIGCGVINREIVRFLQFVLPNLRRLVFFDRRPERAEELAARWRVHGIHTEVATSVENALMSRDVVSIATTASEPHIDDLAGIRAGGVVLNVSLRDLAPRAILAADNVVDDVDHVCRERTSVELAFRERGDLDFVRCTLGDILLGRAPARRDSSSVVVFSPFGLGVLDLAVADLAIQRAAREDLGTMIKGFSSATPEAQVDRR